MKYMLISVGWLLLCLTEVPAQVNIKSSNIQDFTGKPIIVNKVTEVEGSVFYNDSYKNAKIYLANGLEMAEIKIKLNLRDNKVYFLTTEGAEMESISKIKKIIFSDSGAVFENGFPILNKQDAQTYYRVIVAGKASLLVLSSFVDVEFKAFNSATTTRQIEKVNELFGVSSNIITKLSNANDVLKLLTDKNQEVSDFIAKNNLKCKKQADYLRVINYYNSLGN